MATPYSTSCGIIALSTIDGDDCIGDSRVIINTNTQNIGNTLCTLFSSICALADLQDNRVDILSAFVKSLSAKDSPTVDLSFNPHAYFLSADVVNNSLGVIKLGQDVTTFGKQLLTSTNIPLSSLAGVKLTSTPIFGEVLSWDGAFWTNKPSISGTSPSNVSDGDYGDIVVSFSGAAWTIDNDAVTEQKIINNAITVNKIYDGSVSEGKLQTDAVTDIKIKNGAVTESKILSGAVTESKILSGAVTTTKIANQAVTDIKLAQMDALSIKCNPTNSTAVPQNLVSIENKVLVRSGNTLLFGNVPNSATTGTSANNPDTLVLRNTFGSFQGQDITANGTFIGNLSGNVTGKADRADRWETSRRITLTGYLTGTTLIDGTGDVTIVTGVPPEPARNFVPSVEVLLVAGGGGGGGGMLFAGGGGGGAGGFFTFIADFGIQVPYTVAIGAGGGGGATDSWPGPAGLGQNGGSTSITGGTTVGILGYTAVGGGGGGSGFSTTVSPSPGRNGGSGGGAGGPSGGTLVNLGGSGTGTQGSAGGTAGGAANLAGGGAGGGADQVGGSARSSNRGGIGGNGRLWLNGVRYSAGGGGGGSGSDGGTGGLGGGGNGAGGPNDETTGTNGTASTGGGGGGSNRDTGGYSGGSGVCVIRYPGTVRRANGGDVIITGGYVYHYFYTTGIFVFNS